MDLYEILRVMYTRVQALDPKNVSKIVGYLLLQDESEQDMFRLALSSDAVLMSVVSRAKQELGMLNEPLSPHQQQQTYHLLRNKLVNSTSFNSPVFQSRGSSLHQYQQPFLSGGGLFPNDQFYPETFAFLNRSRVCQQQQQQQQQHKVEEYDLSSEHGSPNSSSSSSSSSNNSGGSNTLSFSWKPCVYYSRGHCKHGSSCRFLHTPPSPSPGPVHQETTSLERLEQEIYDILRSRKSPLLISSLQQLYYEEHGRLLHVEEGDESSNLMYLLCNSKRIHLLDHPNGQKAIALNVEDGSPRTAAAVPYCSESANSARQIYMTFPAESTFNEEDVNLHFSAYGHVHDVRIPYQLKRMFGFVTFQHSESVRTILAEGNPHYIRGARVLVKPYRDKVKHTEFRKNDDLSKFSDLIAPKLLERNELQQAAESKYQTETYLAAAVGHLAASGNRPRPDDMLLRQGNCYNDVEEEFPSYTNRDSY